MTQASPEQVYELVVPSTVSTAAFVAVVLAVVAAYVGIFAASYRGSAARARTPLIAFLGLAFWIAVALGATASGLLLQLMGSPKLMGYFALSNALALLLALGPAGHRIVGNVPIAWLVGFQAFRLPLELVLHSWYEQGTLPIQMTYAGDNFDIVTGVLALLVWSLLTFGRLGSATRRWVVLAFNVVGIGLLLTVMSIAVRSTPWPLRTYLNDPPVLLAFYAPYTLILPVCVAGALWGHVLVFRWLWRQRTAASRAMG